MFHQSLRTPTDSLTWEYISTTRWLGMDGCVRYARMDQKRRLQSFALQQGMQHMPCHPSWDKGRIRRCKSKCDRCWVETYAIIPHCSFSHLKQYDNSSYSLASKILEYNSQVQQPLSADEPDLKSLLKEYENQRWLPTTSITAKAAFLGKLYTTKVVSCWLWYPRIMHTHSTPPCTIVWWRLLGSWPISFLKLSVSHLFNAFYSESTIISKYCYLLLVIFSDAFFFTMVSLLGSLVYHNDLDTLLK